MAIYSTKSALHSRRAERIHAKQQEALDRASSAAIRPAPRAEKRSLVRPSTPMPCDPTDPNWEPRYYSATALRRAVPHLPEIKECKRTRVRTIPRWAHVLHTTKEVVAPRYVTPSDAVLTRHVADSETWERILSGNGFQTED